MATKKVEEVVPEVEEVEEVAPEVDGEYAELLVCNLVAGGMSVKEARKQAQQ